MKVIFRKDLKKRREIYNKAIFWPYQNDNRREKLPAPTEVKVWSMSNHAFNVLAELVSA